MFDRSGIDVVQYTTIRSSLSEESDAVLTLLPSIPPHLPFPHKLPRCYGQFCTNSRQFDQSCASLLEGKDSGLKPYPPSSCSSPTSSFSPRPVNPFGPGLEGAMCAPTCGVLDSCPKDVPLHVLAKPSCALQAHTPLMPGTGAPAHRLARAACPARSAPEGQASASAAAPSSEIRHELAQRDCARPHARARPHTGARASKSLPPHPNVTTPAPAHARAPLARCACALAARAVTRPGSPLGPSAGHGIGAEFECTPSLHYRVHIYQPPASVSSRGTGSDPKRPHKRPERTQILRV